MGLTPFASLCTLNPNPPAGYSGAHKRNGGEQLHLSAEQTTGPGSSPGAQCCARGGIGARRTKSGRHRAGPSPFDLPEGATNSQWKTPGKPQGEGPAAKSITEREEEEADVETESPLAVAWGWGRGQRVTENGQEGAFWGDAKVLKLDCGDGCIIL